MNFDDDDFKVIGKLLTIVATQSVSSNKQFDTLIKTTLFNNGK